MLTAKIKYRFLGAVILVGLILIILPMLFDNAIRYQTVTPATRPPLPAITVATQAQQPAVVPPPTRKDMQPIKAYTIQVVSFKEAATVDHLLGLLQKDGFTAYSRRSEKTGFTTVFVGPVLTKDQAELLLTQLTQKYKVKPVITSYKPQEA